MTWSLFVPGEPKTTQTGSVVRLPNGRAIVTRRNTGWAQRIALAAQAARPPRPLEGPVRAVLTFFRTRPVSAPKSVTHPATRPDLGNLSKGLLDCLEGIVYRDDAQIVELVERKVFATMQPGVRIEIEGVSP